MSTREKVISHLQILRTWASFAETRDIIFFTSKHFSDMAIWIDDTIAILKEQEEKIRQLRLALNIMKGNGIVVQKKGSDH